jgi:hypothetical protein
MQVPSPGADFVQSDRDRDRNAGYVVYSTQAQ